MPVCDPKLEPNAPGLIIFGRLHRVHRLIDGGLRDSLLDLPLVEGQRIFQGLFYHETSETNVSELFRYSGACGGGGSPWYLAQPPSMTAGLALWLF